MLGVHLIDGLPAIKMIGKGCGAPNIKKPFESFSFCYHFFWMSLQHTSTGIPSSFAKVINFESSRANKALINFISLGQEEGKYFKPNILRCQKKYFLFVSKSWKILFQNYLSSNSMAGVGWICFSLK